MWGWHYTFRIKPEPKLDVVETKALYKAKTDFDLQLVGNFKLTYNGETGELKSAEVIK